MRIKVGNKWYDGNVTPIIVELSDGDRANITMMPKDKTKYCMAPDTIENDSLRAWMRDEINIEDVVMKSEHPLKTVLLDTEIVKNFLAIPPDTELQQPNPEKEFNL